MDIVYLERDDVLQLYADIFDCTLRQAYNQVRDLQGLSSALARPRHYAAYQEADLSLQAAVLVHGIAEGQVFVDGNKRTAAVVMTQFLLANGYDIRASEEERAAWIINLSLLEDSPAHGAHRDVEELLENLAAYIRDALIPLRSS